MIDVRPQLSPEQATRYREDGYLVVEGFLDDAEVELLREESARATAAVEARLRQQGRETEGLSRVGERYYVAGSSRSRPALRELLCGPRMADVCRATLGPEAYLFTEVFVCKQPHQTVNACWHQDYSYLDFFFHGRFAPNLSAWFALDDMTAENGALQVLPFSAGGPSVPVPHRMNESWDGPDVVDFGPVPPVLLPVRTGALVLMSGLLAHWSAPNRTDRPRRAYVVQYSPRPVVVDGKPLELDYPVIAPESSAAE